MSPQKAVKMKILQIGCGGGGSYFLPEVIECIEQEQISPYTKIFIVDSDIVEVKDTKPRGYQNFYKQDLGKNKAKVLAKRFNLGIKAITTRITKEEELKGYDLIVLCVDNDKTREMVIEYCHKNNKEFLDLRAEGRRYFAMPKLSKLEDNLKFIDKDLKNYSCQEKEDLEKGYIQKGSKICAMVGIQMLLNMLRGHTNKINNGVI